MDTKSLPKMSAQAVSFVWLTSGMTVIHVFVAFVTLAQTGARAKGNSEVALVLSPSRVPSSWSPLLLPEEEEEEEEEEDEELPPFDDDDDEEEEEEEEEDDDEDDEAVDPPCTMLDRDPWKVGVKLQLQVVAVVQ